MNKNNIVSIEFIYRGQYGEYNSWDIIYKLDNEQEIKKRISNVQYKYMQLYLLSIID